MNNILTAIKAIKETDNVVVVGHKNADCDALGSTIAMVLALEKMGINSIGLTDKIIEKYDIVGDYSLLKESLEDDFQIDTLICVDTSARNMLAIDDMHFENAKNVIAIDHHRSHTKYADELYLENDISSCCEMVYNVIENLNVEIDKEIATALYAGMLTDTGAFQFQEVTSNTYKVAANLMDKGIEFSTIAKKVLHEKSKRDLDVLKYALNNIQYAEDYLYIVFRNDDVIRLNLIDSDFDNIKFFMNTIKGYEISMLFREYENMYIKCSIRSDKTDVGKIAEMLGGGGHKFAGGIKSKGKSMEDFVKEVVNTLENKVTV